MLAIQNSLTGQCIPGILAPGRKFLQEGRLMKVGRTLSLKLLLLLLFLLFVCMFFLILLMFVLNINFPQGPGETRPIRTET